MSLIDTNQLIAPVSDELPSGENLENELAYGEFTRAGEATPDQESGDEVVAGNPADWSAVLKQGQELLGRSKDLRIALLMTRAAMNKSGPAGLADGVALLRLLVENFWESVHPQLDAEDNDDPVFRVNSVLELAAPDGMIHDLQNMILVESKVAGKFSLRDTRVASGELRHQDPDRQSPDGALINAAFQDSELEQIQEQATAVEQAIEDIGKFEAIFAENIGAANSPNIDRFVSELKAIREIYAENLIARGVEVAGSGADGAAGAGAAPAGEMRSREDVVLMLGKICTYYERNEPSSPVPILLRRVKKLISMDYLEIMRELTPDAVAQAESLAGIKQNEGY